jgi:hypothetical protein
MTLNGMDPDQTMTIEFDWVDDARLAVIHSPTGKEEDWVIANKNVKLEKTNRFFLIEITPGQPKVALGSMGIATITNPCSGSWAVIFQDISGFFSM